MDDSLSSEAIAAGYRQENLHLIQHRWSREDIDWIAVSANIFDIRPGFVHQSTAVAELLDEFTV